MPAGVDEATWNRAKAQAEKQGKGKNWPYVMNIYQSMSGEKSAALEEKMPGVKPDDVMAPLSTSILNAIETLAKDDWYGFKLDKNKHNVDTMRVFSRSAYSGDSWTVPPPVTLLKAGKSIDWMTQPGDNIDGTAKSPGEKAVLDKWDPLIKKHEVPKEGGFRKGASVKTPLLDIIREQAKLAFTEADIQGEMDRRNQFVRGRRIPSGRGSQALGSVLPRATSAARGIAAGSPPVPQIARR